MQIDIWPHLIGIESSNCSSVHNASIECNAVNSNFANIYPQKKLEKATDMVSECQMYGLWSPIELFIHNNERTCGETIDTKPSLVTGWGWEPGLCPDSQICWSERTQSAQVLITQLGSAQLDTNYYGCEPTRTHHTALGPGRSTSHSSTQRHISVLVRTTPTGWPSKIRLDSIIFCPLMMDRLHSDMVIIEIRVHMGLRVFQV